MAEKIGRNDPCLCGSGKKYKNCCLQKQKQARSPLAGRKFTAKVLSAGGAHKPQPSAEQQPLIKPVDYAVLMERSFGDALHSHEEKPPVPQDPLEYLANHPSGEVSPS